MRVKSNTEKTVKKKKPALIKKARIKKSVPRKLTCKYVKKAINKYDRTFLDLDFKFKKLDEPWFPVMLRDGCDICSDYKLLQYEIESVFGSDAEYFLPAYIEQLGKKIIGILLFDGYVFVKKTQDVNEASFSTRLGLLEGILKETQHQKPVTSRDINSFKTKLRRELKKRMPKKGDRVNVLEGTFKNMTGTVMSIPKEGNVVNIEFRKKTRIVEAAISTVNFEIVKE